MTEQQGLSAENGVRTHDRRRRRRRTATASASTARSQFAPFDLIPVPAARAHVGLGLPVPAGTAVGSAEVTKEGKRPRQSLPLEEAYVHVAIDDTVRVRTPSAAAPRGNLRGRRSADTGIQIDETERNHYMHVYHAVNAAASKDRNVKLMLELSRQLQSNGVISGAENPIPPETLSPSGSRSSSPPPPKVQVSCLFLPVLLGAFWYWTKRRARRVVTRLRHDTVTGASADEHDVHGGFETGGSAADRYYEQWQDDETDEYCVWYTHGGSWNEPPFSPRPSHTFGGGLGGGNDAGKGALEERYVLWIKGGPDRSTELELAEKGERRTTDGSAPSTTGNPSKPSVSTPVAKQFNKAHYPSRTSTAAASPQWQRIEDLYTLDVLGGTLDWTPSAHESAYDACGDTCSLVSGTVSSIGGISIPRFSPMMMDRGRSIGDGRGHRVSSSSTSDRGNGGTTRTAATAATRAAANQKT